MTLSQHCRQTAKTALTSTIRRQVKSNEKSELTIVISPAEFRQKAGLKCAQEDVTKTLIEELLAELKAEGKLSEKIQGMVVEGLVSSHKRTVSIKLALAA